MKKHLKHPPLTKRKLGFFAPEEISILGIKCSIIDDLVKKIVEIDQKSTKIAYLDASHNEAVSAHLFPKYTRDHAENLIVESHNPVNPYQDKIRFSDYDLLLVNGNHNEARRQIVILDPEKEPSIAKRLPQINDILCVVKTNAEISSFPCLEEKFPQFKDLPTYSINDVKGIYGEIKSVLHKTKPKLNALILAGGKSERMGSDKTQLCYHGVPQLQYLTETLSRLGLSPYISVATPNSTMGENYIVDRFTNLGAFGGICSAFQQDPNAAWLVLAADVPFVDEKVIQHLIQQRNPAKVATALKGKSKEFVEPLISIYEPRAYPKLLNFLALGYACPRKMLINAAVEIVPVEDLIVSNANTPEEFQSAIQKLAANA